MGCKLYHVMSLSDIRQHIGIIFFILICLFLIMCVLVAIVHTGARNSARDPAAGFIGGWVCHSVDASNPTWVLCSLHS